MAHSDQQHIEHSRKGDTQSVPTSIRRSACASTPVKNRPDSRQIPLLRNNNIDDLPNHRDDIRPADQHQHRQQHMSHPATGAPGPPRSDPHPTLRATNRPAPSPPDQHPRAPRTHQRTRSPSLSASTSTVTTAPPSAPHHPPARPRPKNQREGRGLQRPRHGGGADQQGQHDSPNPDPIRTLNGTKPALHRHLQRRLTPERIEHAVGIDPTAPDLDIGFTQPPIPGI